MARVFSLEPCKFNISDATRFGEVTYLFLHNESRPSIWSEDFEKLLGDRFNNLGFDAENDFFVVAGSIVAIVQAVAVLIKRHGPIKTLMFSATERCYVEREL